MRLIAFTDRDSHIKLFIWRLNETSYQRKKLNGAFKAISGSEYSSIAERIKRIVFDFGENLSAKYDLFFTEEYKSFRGYLDAEEELDKEKIETILNSQKESENLWKVDANICEGYSLANMFDESIWEEDYLIPKLNNILEN